MFASGRVCHSIPCDSQKQSKKRRNYFAKGKRVPREQWVVLCTALCAGTLQDAFLKVWLGRDEMSFDLLFICEVKSTFTKVPEQCW